MSGDELQPQDPQHREPDPLGWWARFRRSIHDRRRRHDADDKQHPVDRARKWAALHPFTAAILVVGMLYVPAMAGGYYAMNCIAAYNREYSEADRARADAAEAVDVKRQELDDLNLKIYTQSATQEDYEAYREGLRELVDLVHDQQRTREENPLPEFPEGLCGLSAS